MPELSPKQLQACRGLTLLSVALYATSSLILASLLGVDPWWWGALLSFGGFKRACLANLPLVWGWYRLCTGRVTSARLPGVVSVGLAALYWLDPADFIESMVPWVVAGYCGWVGSMVVLIAAERLIAPGRERDQPPK